MDIQTRKLHFIEDFLRYANSSILEKFEQILRQEREKELSKEIKPMTLTQYEHRIHKAIEDMEEGKVKSVKSLKKEIATWK
jgi:ribosomal protein L29